MFYSCCDKVDKTDNSTLTKHRLCTEHFVEAVGNDARLLDLQPVYVCPAFISMCGHCRNAKYVSSSTIPFFSLLSSVLTVAFRPGRCDSSKRHFKICAGFTTMTAKCEKLRIAITPVQITRGEFNAVQELRRDVQPGQQTFPEPVLNAVFKLLVMMARGETGTIPIEMPEPGPESSDEHAGVITSNEDVMRSFSSQMLGNHGTSGVNYMYQF